MKGDSTAAIDFLYKLRPLGPWVLTAVALDKKSIETATFRPETERGCLAWITKHNGTRNIYFALNPPMRDMTKKAEREDIRAVTHLHVDVDPRAGADMVGEEARIRGLFADRLPSSVPPPTVLIFSGGGYQGIWALDEPIPIDGVLEAAEDAKRFNQQLETLFGGDNCHNIDRILRLPGTVNLPDARKQKKGRVPVVARLEEFHPDRSYPLKKFTQATPTQRAALGFGTGSVKVSGNVARLGDVSELDQWEVPDRVKVAIVQGKHPDEPKEGDNSRSAWVFDVACQLVRKKVPDEVIYSVLTDPGFGISESVLEFKSNAGKYALRQIERAHDFAVDPLLQQFNDRYAVVGNIGGKCRVAEEQMDEALQRTRLTLQSFEDLRNRHMHQYVVVGADKQGVPLKMSAGKWWLQHEARRQYDRITFFPGRDTPGAYNLWKGFGVEALPGDGHESFLAHVRENLCANDPERYDYLLRWMARVVQYPATPGEVAVVLRGQRGAGKSFFAKHFGRLLGRHFLRVSNSVHLVGQFNKHLRDVVLLFADEAFFAGDKRHESVLKTLITEETLNIEAKGIDMEASPNYIHLIMAANEDHVIPAGSNERRFFMLDVADSRMQDEGYFAGIAVGLEEGGYCSLLHYLMNLDLKGWSVRKVPRTIALIDQQMRTLDQEEEWWFSKLFDGYLLKPESGWEVQVPKDDLLDDYLNHARRMNYTRRSNQTKLGFFLHKHCGAFLADFRKLGSVEKQHADGYTSKVEAMLRYYSLPTLRQARELWDKLHGEVKWPETIDQPTLADDAPPF